MNGWRVVRLGDVAELTVGHVGSMASEYQPVGVPWLRSQNVKAHSIDLEDIKFVSEEFHQRLSKSMLRPGDVVTVRTGKPGTTSVIPEALRVSNCSDLVITRAGPDLDPRWLSYYMNSAASGYISAELVGAVQQHFNVGSAKKMLLKLPRLSEQIAIAEVLGALDDKIVANSKLAGSAAVLAQLMFDQVSAGVGVQPIGDLLTPILGGTPSRANLDFWGGPHFWASAKDITGAKNSVLITTEEAISDLAICNTKAKPLPAGSVIVTARGTVGAVARLAVPASFNQSCYGFVPGAVPASILYFGILNAMRKAKTLAHGSVFDTITMRTFDHLDFPVFESGAADALDREIAPLLDTVVAKVKENETLAELRDTLLPELMSGRLRVKNVESA